MVPDCKSEHALILSHTLLYLCESEHPIRHFSMYLRVQHLVLCQQPSPVKPKPDFRCMICAVPQCAELDKTQNLSWLVSMTVHQHCIDKRIPRLLRGIACHFIKCLDNAIIQLHKYVKSINSLKPSSFAERLELARVITNSIQHILALNWDGYQRNEIPY